MIEVSEDMVERACAAFYSDTGWRTNANESRGFIRAALEAALSAQPAPEWQERWRMTSRPAQTAVFLPLDTGVDCLACGHDTHPAVPVGVPDGVWGRYASWLLDHCEGEVITEESLQNWLADMLAAAPSAPQGAQRGEG